MTFGKRVHGWLWGLNPFKVQSVIIENFSPCVLMTLGDGRRQYKLLMDAADAMAIAEGLTEVASYINKEDEQP